MKTALEEELGAALSARAATLPADAAARVRAVDYRPRHHSRALPVGLGAATAAGAATAGTVLAVVLGSATPAYAGWSATPTQAAETASSTSPAPDCLSTLASSGSPGSSSDTGTWQTLLSDVRGPFTITLLQNGTSYASCFTGPTFAEVNRISPPTGSSGGASSGTLSVNSQTAGGSGPQSAQGGVGSLVTLEDTSSGDLTQILQNHLATSADGPYTFIDGRVANGVTSVTLVLKDGQDVVSTVADGWFVAWWPGSSDADSAQVTKASATTSEPLVPVSTQGTKFPLGQAGSTSGQPIVPPAPGTCAKPSTSGTSGTSSSSSTSGGPSVSCGAAGSNGKSATAGNSGNSGNSGNTGSGNTGITGPGPTTKSNP